MDTNGHEGEAKQKQTADEPAVVWQPPDYGGLLNRG